MAIEYIGLSDLGSDPTREEIDKMQEDIRLLKSLIFLMSIIIMIIVYLIHHMGGF